MNLDQLATKWAEAKAAEVAATAERRRLQDELVTAVEQAEGGVHPGPEGTFRSPVTVGGVTHHLVMSLGLSYKIHEEELRAVTESLLSTRGEKAVIPVRWKAELDVRLWKKMPGADKKVFDACVESKPRAPSIKLEVV